MVELLWRLVLKINARAVFLFSLLLLCVVLVVLLHRGSRQGAGLKTGGHRVRSSRGDAVPERVAGAMARGDIEDPFTSAFLVAWLDLEASRKREREAARARQTPVVQPKPAPAKPSPAPAKPKSAPKWVGVNYQGMIARTDGSRVALVREVEAGTLHTLKVGDTLLAGRVKDISAEHVLLVVGQDEAEHPLRVGVVTRVRKDGP
ncbi:MAG: hypothetical protein ISS31_01860 [Kiritimatiellae bacterium]|nr:hypothetical protein [Kiritimatiellia bacterium]